MIEQAFPRLMSTSVFISFPPYQLRYTLHELLYISAAFCSPDASRSRVMSPLPVFGCRGLSFRGWYQHSQQYDVEHISYTLSHLLCKALSPSGTLQGESRMINPFPFWGLGARVQGLAITTTKHTVDWS